MSTEPGRVILLVGPSCAGKTTLAQAVQTLSTEPYLVQSLDALFAATPDAWGSRGAHAADGFRYDQAVPDMDSSLPVQRILCGAVGRRLLSGFHRAVAAYAAAGVNVVVDDMLLDHAVLADWADALAGLSTLLVTVTAPKSELLRRETARDVHRTPGLAAGHFEAHATILADFKIDTSILSPTTAARILLDRTQPGSALGVYRNC